MVADVASMGPQDGVTINLLPDSHSTGNMSQILLHRGIKNHPDAAYDDATIPAQFPPPRPQLAKVALIAIHI